MAPPSMPSISRHGATVHALHQPKPPPSMPSSSLRHRSPYTSRHGASRCPSSTTRQQVAQAAAVETGAGDPGRLLHDGPLDLTRASVHPNTRSSYFLLLPPTSPRMMSNRLPAANLRATEVAIPVRLRFVAGGDSAPSFPTSSVAAGRHNASAPSSLSAPMSSPVRAFLQSLEAILL